MEERYGAHLVAQTLIGSEGRKVKEFNLDELSTYNIVDDYSTDQIEAIIRVLLRSGFLIRSTEFNNLKLTDKGKKFINRHPQIFLPQKLLDDAKTPLFSSKLTQTHLETLKLYNQRLNMSEIAELREMSLSTIESHLADLVWHDKITNIDKLVASERQKLINKVFDKHPEFEKLKEIKEILPEEISFGEIKIVLANRKPKNSK